MKKLLTLTFIIAAVLISSKGYSQAYKNGDKLLNVGIGLNSYYTGGTPFGASFEVGITDQISVGGNLDYLSTSYDFGGKFTAIYVGGRGSYHVNELLKIDNDKIDLYGGVGLGYRSFSWKDTYSGASLGSAYGSGVYFGLHIGGKYYFSDNIGAFVELGAIGSTNARIGVAFKF